MEQTVELEQINSQIIELEERINILKSCRKEYIANEAPNILSGLFVEISSLISNTDKNTNEHPDTYKQYNDRIIEYSIYYYDNLVLQTNTSYILPLTEISRLEEKYNVHIQISLNHHHRNKSKSVQNMEPF